MSEIGAKSLHDIERQRIGGAVDDMGLPMTENKRVAIRRRTGDMGAADRSCGPRQVFNDDGLTEGVLHPVGEHAAKGVGRPASRKWHHDSDRPRGKRLCPRETRSERSRGGRGQPM